MENKLLTNMLFSIPELIKNTHFDLSLEGWPATVAIISGCITAVAIAAIIHQDSQDNPQHQKDTKIALPNY